MKSLHLPRHDACIRWHEIAGEGQPVLALPGLCFPAVGSFLAVATHPAMRGRRWIMADLLGSGVSDHPATPLRGLDAHADALADLLEHIGCGPVAAVGHSMGGSTAIALAHRRPDLVARLVVGEANLAPGGGVATRRIAATGADAFAATALPRLLASRREAARAGDARAAFVAGAWSVCDPRALHADACALAHLPDDFMERFLALTLPRTFLYGAATHPSATGAATPDAPDPAPLTARGVRVETVPDCGHDLMLENPDGFAAALLNALEAP